MSDSWTAPGEGMWARDTEHMPGPRTRYLTEVFAEPASEGFVRGLERYALPLEVQFGFVNAHMYARVCATSPETWNTCAAREPFARDLWRSDLRDWEVSRKDEIIRGNLALQDENIEAMDDAALAEHVERASRLLADGIALHMELVSVSMPLGEFLAAAADWGLQGAELTPLLQGASPSSTETIRYLQRITAALRTVGVEPSTLDEIAKASQEARDALAAYLRMFGWRMVSTYDVNGRTLCELPDSIVASVRAMRVERSTDTVDMNSIRARIPAEERPRFDDLLERARAVAGFEDDNVGITLMWRLGLARRCLLEAGARLVARGAIAEREDVFEATRDEISGLLNGAAVPTKEELALRTAQRVRRESEDAAPVIGEEEDLQIDRMPPVVAARVAAMLTLFELGMSSEADELAGSGIGTESYRGVARVAVDPVDAIARLEPGDVLVVPYTTPAFSTVMVMAGALVVESGGPLIHAAVLAREFGIPAVVGARGAVAAISDGDEVEVDPVAGRIRVVTRAG